MSYAELRDTINTSCGMLTILYTDVVFVGIIASISAKQRVVLPCLYVCGKYMSYGAHRDD